MIRCDVALNTKNYSLHAPHSNSHCAVYKVRTFATAMYLVAYRSAGNCLKVYRVPPCSLMFLKAGKAKKNLGGKWENVIAREGESRIDFHGRSIAKTEFSILFFLFVSFHGNIYKSLFCFLFHLHPHTQTQKSSSYKQNLCKQGNFPCIEGSLQERWRVIRIFVFFRFHTYVYITSDFLSSALVQ